LAGSQEVRLLVREVARSKTEYLFEDLLQAQEFLEGSDRGLENRLR
jgi:hypothetical protein